MLKKEIKDTFREFFVILSLIVVIILLATIKNFDFYLIPLLELILLLYPTFSGWSIFSRERKEGGFEHLFSLPIGKLSILLNKLIPRLAAILIVLGIYFPIREFFASFFFFERSVFVLLYILLFILSFSFSLLFTSGAIVFVSVIIIGAILAFVIKMLGLFSYNFLFFFISIPILTFPMVFIYSFLKDDILPLQFFNKKYLTRSIFVFFVVLLGLSIIVKVSGFNENTYYLLSDDGKIIISNSKKTMIVDSENNKKIFSIKKRIFPIIVKEKFLYGGMESKDGAKLVSIDLKKGKIKILYKVEKYYRFVAPHVDEEKLTFLVKRGGENKFILLIKKDKMEKINCPKKFINEDVLLFKLISNSPLTFVYTKQSYKTYLYKEGRIKYLFKGDCQFYKDKIGLCDSKSFKVFQNMEDSNPVFVEEGKCRILSRWFEWPYERRYIIIKAKTGNYIFDFETLSLSEIKLKIKKNEFVGTGNFGDKLIIAVWNNNSGKIKVLTFSKGEFFSEKIYSSSFKGRRYIFISKKGMMVVRWMKKYEFIKF